VLNLGIEGIMLMGAMTAVAATIATGNIILGILGGIAAGAVLGLVFAFLTVTIRADHVVSGLAMVLLGDGLSRFAGHGLVGVNVQQQLSNVAIPLLADIPVLGPVFFQRNLIVYISYGAVLVIWFFLYWTRAGLALRAAGEKPSAADVAGWNVFRIRYVAVMFGAGMAGLAGAFLSVGYLNTWADGMTAGRGWVALALVIFAGWHPIKLLGGAYLFGAAYMLIVQSQVLGGAFQYVSGYIMQMFPYVLAIVVLTLLGSRRVRRRSGAPAALAMPYYREER
jgi:simple sugar transport system permease protein